MYRRLGAPVEKVLAFLTDLRSRQRSQRDQYNIDWMMEVGRRPAPIARRARCIFPLCSASASPPLPPPPLPPCPPWTPRSHTQYSPIAPYPMPPARAATPSPQLPLCAPQVIASDELYAVVEFDEDTLLQGAGGDATAASDMARFVSAETGFGRRRAQSFDIDGEKGEGGEGGEGDNKSFNNGGGAAGGVGNSFVGGRRSSPSENMKQLWAGAAIASSSLNIKLQRLVSPAEAWAFDIFDYELACSSLPEPGTGRCATLLCYYLLEQHGVLDSLSIERQKLLAWLTRVEDAYPSSNPYHNSLHAADVCANIDYFLRQGNLSRCLSPIDYLSALIAAVVHDMRHPGVNNTFLEASHDELAVTYNDVSVLENHHVASAFKLLKDEEYDWTKALSPEDYKDLRETVILMILGTDMRAHFEHLTKFKSKLAGDGFKAEHVERKDSRLLLTVALHAADIANPAKPQPIATAWARRSMEEFFRQGDREAELGLPVSPFMDRSKAPLAATIVNCQIGFINVLVRPLLTEWASFLGAEAERDIVVTLGATLRLWETSGAKVIDSWGDFGSAPSGGGKADAALLPDKAGAAVAAAGAGKKAARTVSSTESRLSDRSVESMSKRSGSIQQKL